MAYPSIYPTGTTLYDPDKCFNGYTVYEAKEAGILIMDMNGREIQYFKGLHGFPPKLLPGGQLLAHTGERSTKFTTQDKFDLVQVDWDGKHRLEVRPVRVRWTIGRDPPLDGPAAPRQPARGQPGGLLRAGHGPKVDGGKTMISATRT